jgi:hypothetical protein
MSGAMLLLCAYMARYGETLLYTTQEGTLEKLGIAFVRDKFYIFRKSWLQHVYRMVDQSFLKTNTDKVEEEYLEAVLKDSWMT